jgi:ribosomal protein S18 acetylase RimI-like enzyme
MVFNIRWFGVGDVDDVVGLHSQCAECFEDLDVSREFILSVEQRSDFRLAVAEDSGRVVGFAGVLFHESVGRAELGPIAVLPEYRQRGVGRLLLDFVFGCLRSFGVVRVVVVVKSLNQGALSFFLEGGFGVEAYLRGYTRAGEDAVQLVLFL